MTIKDKIKKSNPTNELNGLKYYPKTDERLYAGYLLLASGRVHEHWQPQNSKQGGSVDLIIRPGNSVTRWLVYAFKIWPFATLPICPKL